MLRGRRRYLAGLGSGCVANPVLRELAVGGAAGAVGAVVVALAINASGSLLINSDVVGASIGSALTIGGTLFIERHLRTRREREERAAIEAVFVGLRSSLAAIKDATGTEARDHLRTAQMQKRVLDDLRREMRLGLVAHAALIKFGDEWEAHSHQIEEAVRGSVMYPTHGISAAGVESIGYLVAQLDLIIANLPRS